MPWLERAVAQMSVSEPDPMKDWREARVRQGRYSITSDYVREPIRRVQDRQAGVRTPQVAIDEGLASGRRGRPIDDFLADERPRAE